MKKHSRWVLAAVSGVLVWELACGRALASGSAGPDFGGELGSVVAVNPTAIYFNPGALGFAGTQLMVDGMLVMRYTSWTHAQGQGEVPEPPGYEGANYGTARSFLIAGGPPFGVSVELGKHLVLGAGVYIPYGGGSIRMDRNERFTNSMYPGAADGITRWHGYESGMRFFYATAAAAVRFGAFSFGASFNLIWAWLAVQRAQGGVGNNDLAREQRMSFEISETVASFGLGVMWEVFPEQLWLGVSYQAQPGLGELSMDGTAVIDPTVNVMDATRTQAITMYQSMPDIIRSGVRIKLSRSVELRWTASFTRWSVNQTQCTGVRNLPCTVNADGSAAPGSGAIKVLRRNWQDTIGVHAGLSVWVVPEVELFAGVGYEQAAVPDAALDPWTADAENFTGALGVRVRLLETWFVALSYSHKQFLPRDNTGKSDLASPAFGPIVRGPDGSGKYEAWMASAHLNLAKTF